jgi:hypothetical protein
MKFVICSSKNNLCPSDCEHSIPHTPDEIILGKNCDEVAEQCHLIKSNPHCICE